jgi:hypothetical protein
LRTALLAAPFLLTLPATSLAIPLIFTYDCTIDGSSQGGQGTNSCAGGPTIAQVRISETSAVNPDAGGSAVLLVEARLQFSEPQNPPDNTFRLDALWLNIDETLLGASLGDNGLPWFNGSGSNDYNTLLFDFDGNFASDAQVIKVEANSTNGGSWKNFDLGLCKPDTGQAPGSCDLDLPIVDLATSTADTQPWTTLGFLNSGNGYDLQPGDFDYLTTNVQDAGVLSYLSDCGWPEGELSSGIKLEPATSPTLNSPCLSGVSYGPRYGAAALAAQVPEPNALALIGAGLFGLAAARRRARQSASNS